MYLQDNQDPRARLQPPASNGVGAIHNSSLRSVGAIAVRPKVNGRRITRLDLTLLPGAVSKSATMLALVASLSLLSACEEPPEEGLTLAMSFGGSTIALWNDITEIMEKSLAEKGHRLITHDPQFRVDLQVNDWRAQAHIVHRCTLNSRLSSISVVQAGGFGRFGFVKLCAPVASVAGRNLLVTRH